jgi:hypothetical protein
MAKEGLMESDERNKFEELRLQAGCSRNFACVSSSIRHICNDKYDPDNDTIECLKCESQDCGFAEPVAAGFICICPLRSYIVKNFDKWIVDTADRIRRHKLLRL